MRISFRSGLAFLLILVLSATAGCGGVTGPEVRGSVTFAGSPLESGSISFIPIEGTPGPAGGGAIVGGKYHVASGQGLGTGTHRVEIRATRKTGRNVEAGPGTDDPNSLVEEVQMFIPPDYNTKSTLVANVQAGTNELDFDLPDRTR